MGVDSGSWSACVCVSRTLTLSGARLSCATLAPAVQCRCAKGGHERVTMLPASLITPLQEHLKRVKLLHEQDLAAGYGCVYLPYALDRKYPNASREWSKRQYVFPSDRLSTDPRNGIKHCHHVDESNLQRAVKACPE